MSKSKVLFVLHFSPPIHGAAKVGDIIVNSKLIRGTFNTRFIKIKSSSGIDEIGAFKIKKIWLLTELFLKVVFQLIIFRPQKIYYTPSPSGFAFYRDLIIMLPVKIYIALHVVKKSPNLYLHYHAKGIKIFIEASKISKNLTKLLIKNASIIFISDMMKDEIKGVNNYKNIFILNNGVSTTINEDAFETLLKNKTKENKINVLYLSNMIKDKGYDKVLEVAKSYKVRENEDIHFHFAGSWSSTKDQQYFKQFVADNFLEDKVTYHGLVTGQTKEELFKKSNLFIFPTTYKKEVFPLSLLEALSFGLPILTFNTGAIQEIMTTDIGVISNDNNLLADFKRVNRKYLNTNTYNLCRKHFLNNYTETIFAERLIEILKT